MIAIYRDQLNGEGLFAGLGGIEGDHTLELLDQVEQWEQIQAKISSEDSC